MTEIDQKHQKGKIEMDKLIKQLAVQQGMRIDGRYEVRYGIYDAWTGKEILEWEVHKLDD